MLKKKKGNYSLSLCLYTYVCVCTHTHFFNVQKFSLPSKAPICSDSKVNTKAVFEQADLDICNLT